MRKVFLITMLLLILLPLTAQSNIPRPNFSPYNNNGSSLLNWNKLSMSHSLGFLRVRAIIFLFIPIILNIN